jgi:PKD repeat protein
LRRLLLFAAVVAVLGLAGGAVHAADNGTRLLGITGSQSRFITQTGQDSQVRQGFLGWGQGQTYGSPFASLLPTLAPIPMLHLGTGGRTRAEAVTPQGIATGQGDGYLSALAQAISVWGKGIYVRPMAEMNNSSTFYSAYQSNGSPKDAAHSTAWYRKAFARIYLVLHGGPVATINARLAQLGLPALRGGDLPTNPFPRLRVVWSPLASDSPRVPGNAAENYYPGAAYVDVEGGDIYDERATDTAPWGGLEKLFEAARGRGKPFSVPEWGLTEVDDPAFVRHMCKFAQTHPAAEVLAYYESRAGSRYDLGDKPQSRAAYRACLTPLKGDYPAWAAANVPGAGAKLVTLTLTATPPAGPTPLAVTFAAAAKLTVPIRQWQLAFGDGTQTGGTGQPPATFQHTYAADGIYDATLIVSSAAPVATFLTTASVAVGAAPKKVVSFVVTPGRNPLAIVVQTDLALAQPATSWQIAWGDGKVDRGTGTPPHFTGHTYAKAGTYRAVLTVNTAGGTYVTFSDVTVAQPTGPPQGTPTGTVLVNGAPFTGGTVPYGAKVDVTKGRLTMSTEAGSLLVFGNGVPAAFVLSKVREGGKTIVVLRLAGGNFAVCGKRTVARAAGASVTKKKVVRQLWGSGKGNFRTSGRYASATVRGTVWLTADRCDGTQVTVRQGVVQVRDIVKRTTVSVRAGQTYLARKP